MARRRRGLLPSPAVVVALTALVMSLGGSAYALVITGKQIKDGTVTGEDIRNRSLTGNDMARDRLGGETIKESTLGVVPAALVAHGAARFAVVDGGGLLRRGRDVSSTARTGPGRHQVIFNADIRNCAYLATIGNPSAAGPPQNSQISVASLASNVNGVDVHTANRNGPQQTRGFHLIVMC